MTGLRPTLGMYFGSKEPREAVNQKPTSRRRRPPRRDYRAGDRRRLVFTRETASPCAAEVTFPDLAVSATLPVGQSVLVELPAAAGEHTFQCAMGMLGGA